MSERRRERSRSRERRHHSSHHRDDYSQRDNRHSRHSSDDRLRQSDGHRQRDRRGEHEAPSERRPEDAQRHHDHSRHARHGRDERHDERRGERHTAGGRHQADGQAGLSAGVREAAPSNGAAVLDAMVPTQPGGGAVDAADGRRPPHRPRPGAPPGPPQRSAPGQQQQQQRQQPQPQQTGAAGHEAQQGAQPVRINPHGMYARAIEDTDYIVPRGGYFFEHDDRDVVTFKEELRRPRNGGPGGAPGQPAAGGGGRGRPDAGGSFIVEDPGDRWEDRGPPPPRQRGRDWADSEAAEPMDRQRRPRRGGASEGIFGLHRNSDFRGGSWQGGRGRGSSFGGGGGFGGGGKWSHDMFETVVAGKTEATVNGDTIKTQQSNAG